MNPVESRPLRYFVVVAEELNFTRAAERRGIASPALSRAISVLETELGVRLLERSTRRVTLTEAGAGLLADARLALDALDAAAMRARRAAGVEGGKLVLAVKADVEGGLLEAVLAKYEAERAPVPIEVVFTGGQEQPQLLRAGEADVAILLEPFDVDGLDTEPLLSEPQVLGLPAGHSLAERHSLRLADIEAGHRQVGPGAHVYIPHGAQRPRFEDMTQMLRQIELGRMLALFPCPSRSATPVGSSPGARSTTRRPRPSHSHGRRTRTRSLSPRSCGSRRRSRPIVSTISRAVRRGEGHRDS